ncbi:MAG: hypothetical protein U0L20_06395 [Ruminococcus sp.]|nr:hypothetical protein [Ruminococcus sp.]
MGFLSKFFKKVNTKSAIELAHDNTPVIGEQRHINNWNIIDNYKQSENPLDILAVAISYEREGAKYRKESIFFYEKFLTNPTETPILPNRYLEGRKPVRMFSNWQIYSSLANLYEKEYEFTKAIEYLKKLPKESGYKNSADYTRVGDVLAKVDINECVSYYENLITTSTYKKFTSVIDCKYKEALKKQSEGYVFKARKKRI